MLILKWIVFIVGALAVVKGLMYVLWPEWKREIDKGILAWPILVLRIIGIIALGIGVVMIVFALGAKG